MPFTMLVNLVELCGAQRNLGCGLSQKPLRRIKAAPSQLGCAAANEDAQANVFPLLPACIVASGSCAASEALVAGDAMPQVPLRFTWLSNGKRLRRNALRQSADLSDKTIN